MSPAPPPQPSEAGREGSPVAGSPAAGPAPGSPDSLQSSDEPTSAEPEGPSGRGRRRRRALVAVGVVAAAAAAAAAVVAVAGGEDGPSGCLSGLAQQAPQDGGVLQGSDLGRARASGMDDSEGLAGAMDWIMDTGVSPDPLTREAWASFMGGDTSSVTGYEPAAVRCWAGGLTGFAASGSFDAGRIAATDLGSSGTIDVDGDLLVRRETATDRSAGGQGPAPTAATLLEALDDHGAVAFTALSVDDAGDQWTAAALADDGGVWDLLVVWAFADPSGAEAAEGEVREALADRSSVGDLVEGDPVQQLERDGTTLWLRAPLATETTSDWYRLQSQLDSVFFVGDD